MRYWRSARLGNALTADTSPHPDQYMPDLWPEVHAFVHSIVQVRTIYQSSPSPSHTIKAAPSQAAPPRPLSHLACLSM
jgi:hypothetical protein